LIDWLIDWLIDYYQFSPDSDSEIILKID